MTRLLINQGFLMQGIKKWRSNTNWDQDFHNRFYSRLKEINFLSTTNWRLLVDELISWKAHRPLSREQLIQRGYLKIRILQSNIDTIINRAEFTDLDISNFEWEQLDEIFEIANSIKGYDSPMFGSKLCHFLMPNLFPVYDSQVGERVGTSDYPLYWRMCCNGWVECSEKEILQNILANQIGGEVIPTYPWATKLAELCCLGGGVQVE